MDKKIFILLIVLNSCLLAAGIVMIFTNCSIYGNWWPLLSILVFLVGLVPPILCNAYQFGFDKTDSILFDNTSDAELGGILNNKYHLFIRLPKPVANKGKVLSAPVPIR